ncbi:MULTISPECIES: TetR/AcrR family transcriptional regulator [unclassified Micromonospora]|uniref:TetR/AcrR family transcriptional regulator n=1 Tax=unclassified Micromonospora TaxID=2617518 RepID=UPI000DE8E6BC|nr:MULTISPECIES: TetR/AcrR family transcriptional regulator [unclassified Micromonospora]MBQ1061909.1 TetR/AcrR family transcriptional regulator [Micromonospora sp. C41]RBQ05665.1 TetR/AcrR family transcriptional regulator [Micromonospora sp. LHW51205]
MSTTQDRRSVILDNAAHLFAAKGIDATTVREIADSVGILSGSLYHHFKSKDEMVNAIISDYLTDLTYRYGEVLASEEKPATQLRKLVTSSLANIEAHPHATEIYQNSSGYLPKIEGYEHIREAAATIQRAWIQVLEAGIATGDFRNDIPVRVLHGMLRDALWLSVRWFKPTPSYSMANFADDFVSVFLDGILAQD